MAALFLTATACGERSEPTGPSVDLYPVTVANGDSTLVLDHPAMRIAVIAPDLTGILGALGVGSRVVGTPVAPNGAIRLEQLRALKPDLVVASGSSTDERQISRAAAAAKARVYVAADSSIRDLEHSITQLGLVTNTAVAARRLVRQIEARRSRVAKKLRGAPPVSVFLDTGFFTPAPDQSLADQLIREAHGRNVTTGGAAVGPLDLKTLARLNPRVYLATSDSGTTLAELRKNRRSRKLSAVRNSRFAIIDQSLLTPGPRIGDGLVAIARALHPNAFR
jgi:iron complex transport system substrate-binding protein